MLEDGRKPKDIASIVGCSVSTVQRVKFKYDEQSIQGLVDRSEDNGDLKLTEEHWSELVELVFKTPLDFGYDRPTWTRELLVIVLRNAQVYASMLVP
jgi:transposase